MTLIRIHPALPYLLAALAAGLIVAALPLDAGLALLLGAALLAAAFWEPALGLGLAVGLGPLKALVEFSQSGITADTGDLFRALPLALRQVLMAVPPDLGQVFLLVAVAGWLARELARRALVVAGPPPALGWALAAFVGLGLASLIGAPAPEEGLKEVFKWVEIGVVVVVVVSERARGRLPWLVAGVLAAGAAQAALGYWQYDLRGAGPSHFRILGDHWRAYGTFEQPNPYGGFLGLIWPVAAGLGLAAGLRAWYSRQARRLWLAGGLGGLAGLMLLGLFVSFSRGAWLGAAAAALAVTAALPRRRWVGLGLVIGGLAGFWAVQSAGLLPASLAARLGDVGDFVTVTDVRGATITVDNFAIVERLAHWQAAAAMAQDHPWLGVGLGNYGAAYPAYALLNWPLPLGHAHMIYLNVLAETGVLGLTAYLALWLAVFALTMRAVGGSAGLERGLAVGLLGTWTHLSVHQLVDNLYVNNIHLLLAVLLGLLVVLVRSLPPTRNRVNSLEPVSR